MTLEKMLLQFYKENGIPDNGGEDDDRFSLVVFGINVILPNFKFRKEIIHIHDIQHILNNCDTTWKGEAFIAGWEVSTGLWKRFPINILVFWTMGYSLWSYPVSVLKGFKRGLNHKGIIDLGISKSDFMKWNLKS